MAGIPALRNRTPGIYTYKIEAILAEADGYIPKNAGKDELQKALHRITDGGTYFADDIVPIIYKQYHQQKIQEEQLKELTEREKEILNLIVKEYTSVRRSHGSCLSAKKSGQSPAAFAGEDGM